MVINGYSRKNMKRRGSKRNNEYNFCSSIQSLPNELLTDVVARVASRSFKNFINVKLRFLMSSPMNGNTGRLSNCTMAKAEAREDY
ncbi:hypothetical protein P3S67_024319 [Capsicum chacoense]